MFDPDEIQEHMAVVGADGEPVGTVDKVEGNRIKLTKSDPSSGGEHHFLHLDMIDGVEDGKVRLVRTAEEARDEWGVEAVGKGESDARGVEPGSSTSGP